MTSALHRACWSHAGMGKRGGARVIYYNRLANGDIVLLLVVAKAKFDQLWPPRPWSPCIKANPKKPVQIRFDPDVLEALRATGKG